MRSGDTPDANCSSSDSCEWVVVAGWITSVFASPTFARLLANLVESTTLLPTAASSPPLTPKLNTLQNVPSLSVLRANWCEGCDSRPRKDTQATFSCCSRYRARARALSEWRCARSDSVSRPCKRRNAPKGLRQAPRSRNISTRSFTAYATFPNVSENLRP